MSMLLTLNDSLDEYDSEMSRDAYDHVLTLHY
jgi:hypothetical protein